MKTRLNRIAKDTNFFLKNFLKKLTIFTGIALIFEKSKVYKK